nr:hypothetical protein [Elizabethkingia bruuniana]
MMKKLLLFTLLGSLFFAQQKRKQLLLFMTNIPKDRAIIMEVISNSIKNFIN